MKFYGLFFLIFKYSLIFSNVNEIANCYYPSNIKLIIGSIEDPDGIFFNKNAAIHHNFQVRFQGQSCRTDQNGCFYLNTTNFSISEPLYLLISNGCYWTKQKEVVKNKTFEMPTLRQDPKKNFKFYQITPQNEKLSFVLSNNLLKNSNYEIPATNTIILNINPNYVEELIIPIKNFIHHSAFLTLPNIKLKRIANIAQQKNKTHFKKIHQNLSGKSSLRKIKHSYLHQLDTEISQTTSESKHKKSHTQVLLSRINGVA